MPGSLQVPVMDATTPSGTVTEPALAATEGAPGLTVSAKVLVLLVPLPSVAVMVTVLLSSGPSAVGDDHVHVPSTFWITLPADAVRVTGSMPLPPPTPVLM